MILEALKAWIRDVIIMVFSLAMLETLLPRGEIKKAARIVVGLATIAVIIAPLTKIQYAGWGAPGLPGQSQLQEGLGRQVDLAATTSEEYIARGEAMRAAGTHLLTEETRKRIERQVEALVSLGNGMQGAGRDISARVEIAPSPGDMAGIDIAGIEIIIGCDEAGAGYAREERDIERLRRTVADFYGLDRERVSVVMRPGGRDSLGR
ncbi:MAG TPA: stage III sporulation protein AF [Firmicutes bacterium]|nr:stage III sporulation protein AF [Bacillota bacterium]